MTLAGLPLAVAELCEAVGLQVISSSEFAPGAPPMVYGPLDSIAILLDLLMFENEQECCGNLSIPIDAEQ